MTTMPFASLLMGFVLLAAPICGHSSAAEHPPDATEDEMTNATTLGEHRGIVVDSKTFVIERGRIYRLIQGKRYQPRCRDPEMEQSFPRILLGEQFDKRSRYPTANGLLSLDQLRHALKTCDEGDGNF